MATRTRQGYRCMVVTEEIMIIPLERGRGRRCVFDAVSDVEAENSPTRCVPREACEHGRLFTQPPALRSDHDPTFQRDCQTPPLQASGTKERSQRPPRRSRSRERASIVDRSSSTSQSKGHVQCVNTSPAATARIHVWIRCMESNQNSRR